MLGAGGPALGVFLLGSLMWNVDLLGGPNIGRAHPRSFLSLILLLCSSPFESRNYARFFYPIFWVDMGGRVEPPKKAASSNLFFRLVNAIIFSWLTLFSKDVAYKFATYNTRSGSKTTGFMTSGIAYC